jgi:microcystin-dependent protein
MPFYHKSQQKRKVWSLNTPGSGTYIEAEYNQLYDNTDYLKSEVESLKTETQLRLPIGTILMYDGSNWQDNVTLPGWYACISSNSTHSCPDLVDRFVMGGSTAGTTGGSNHTTLTTANLPSHNHNFVVDSVTGGGHLTLAAGGVSNVNTSTAGNHSHSYAKPNKATQRSRCECTSMLQNSYGPNNTSSTGSHSHSISLSSHQHVVEDHSHSISAHIEETGQNQSFDNRSAFYQLILIRRCS